MEPTGPLHFQRLADIFHIVYLIICLKIQCYSWVMCLLFFPPNQELQLGMAGYDGHRVDDADLIDVPVTLQVARFGGLPGSFCMAALPPHCLGCRALPSGSLRVEYTQSRSSVRYKWVLWSCSSGGCCRPRKSEIK